MKDPIVSLEASLPDDVQNILPLIAAGRRVLAVRGYLRSEKSLEARWSWTDEEIEAYTKSPEYATALEDIDKVKKAFEAANDGYTLRVNTEIRSIDDQIDSWNRNRSVEAASTELVDDLDQWLDANPEATPAKARAFLNVWRPVVPVSLATPGLSPHGQARAFDFQVQRGSEIVAGADTKAIHEVWEKGGWTEKLKQAIASSKAPFVGPLERPFEPWHYDYHPPKVAPKPDPEVPLPRARPTTP